MAKCKSAELIVENDIGFYVIGMPSNSFVFISSMPNGSIDSLTVEIWAYIVVNERGILSRRIQILGIITEKLRDQ